MEEKILRIINHYGLINQKLKLLEEVGELLEAESEMYYGADLSNNYERLINHILEEYTDVQVVLEQHRLYWKLVLEDIKEVFEYKVDRTNGEIDEELLRPTERPRNRKGKITNTKGEKETIL